MNNSRLIKILKSFSSKERRHCQYWLDNPLHNQREDVCLLYQYLWSNKLKKKVLAKEKIWSVIYPKTTYNDGKMRQIIHLLLLEVEEFLVYTQLKKKENGAAAILLLQALKERQLHSILDYSIKNTKENFQKKIYPNWQGLRWKYELETLAFESIEQQGRTLALNLQELSDALDIQYFADKLRKTCLLYSRLVVFKMDYQPKMLEVVLQQVQDSDYLKIPAIAVYYYCYQSLTTKENADNFFQKMLDCLHENSKLFPTSEIRELYLLAINYTIKKLNEGSIWHLQKAYELYKTGITAGYLLQEGILSPFSYNNMVSIGLELKENDWVEQFIHEYKPYITPQSRQSIFEECLAKLYYTKKDYSAAQKLLVQIETKDILRILSCKIMLAKIYYETDEYDALESLLNSLKTYLRRKDVVGYHKDNYKNTTLVIQKLIRVNPFDKTAIEKLKTEVNQISPLTIKDWVLEQLNTL